MIRNNFSADKELQIAQCKAEVYAYIMQLTHDRDLTDDIFQEVSIRVLTKIRKGEYHDSGKFVGWVKTIAHNMVIDYMRSSKNDCVYNDDLINEDAALDDNEEDMIVKEQINETLHRLINNLPEPQTEIIRMHYFEDLSFNEIAEKKNISINTALGRARYALINLREMKKLKNIIIYA
jgi:RNA polymerase sigma-70 factor (ECF subfamily)